MSPETKPPSSAASVHKRCPLWHPYQVRPEGAPGAPMGLGVQSVQSYLLSRKRKPPPQTAQAGRVRSPVAKELFLEEVPSLEQLCWVFCGRYLSLRKSFNVISWREFEVPLPPWGWEVWAKLRFAGGFQRMVHGSGTPGSGGRGDPLFAQVPSWRRMAGQCQSLW